VGLLIADLQGRIAATDLALELTPAARAVIQREGTDPAYGARPLKRTIQRLVENPFARAMLSGTFHPGDIVVADADPVSGNLVFTAAGGSVVSDPSEHRDARSSGSSSTGGARGEGLEAAAAGVGGVPEFDLPALDTPKKKPDGGLVN